MKENIFESKGKERELFKDERILYPEFVPERLPFRDKEIEELVFALKPVAKGRKPENVFVFGATGTGKTVTVKYVLRELLEYTDRAKSVFINCFEHNSRYAVLLHVANSIGCAIPGKGAGSGEILEKIASVLKGRGVTPLIVLDEADQLLRESQASKLFYDLLRLIEREKARFGLIYISNDAELTARLDDRVKSSLAEKQLLFEKYSPEQLKKILEERAEYAFFPSVLEKDVINLIAANAAKQGGDARIAIECLLRAGRIAEKENSGRIGIEHVRKALAIIQPRQEQKAFPFLSENEKKILSLLQEEKSSGELHEEFSKKFEQEITLRRFREIINALEAKHLIKTRAVSLKGRGRTRVISKA